MQTDNWRHISDVLGGLGLIDAGMERGGHAAMRSRPSADTHRERESCRGFRATEGGSSRPKLKLIWSDGHYVSHPESA